MRLSSLNLGPTYMTLHHSCPSIQNSSLITPSPSATASAAASLPNNFRESRPDAVNSHLRGNVPLRPESKPSSSSEVSADGIMRKGNSMVGTSRVISGTGLLADGLSSGTVPRVRLSPYVTSTGHEMNSLGNASEMSSQVSTSTGLLADGPSSGTVPRVTLSPCVTRTGHEMNSLGNASDMSSRVSTSIGLLADKLSSSSVPRVRLSPCVTSTGHEMNSLGNASEMSSRVSTSYDHLSPTTTSSYPSQQAQGFRVNQSIGQQKGVNNAGATPLKKQQQILLMYHHAMVCRKKEACELPICAKLKKTFEHAVQCDGVNCKRSCEVTRKMIRHFKACCNPRCVICGPVKEIISRGGTNRIDNGESKRHDVPASDEPWPKRVKTDQHDEMLCDRSNDLKNESNCSVTGVVLVEEEAKVKSVKRVFVDVSDDEAGVQPVEYVKDSYPLCAKKVDKCARETVGAATKQRVRGASLLDTFAPEEIRVHLSSLRMCERKTQEKGEQSQPLDQVQDQNTCSLCGMEELLFAPPQRYCGKCTVLIVSHGVYYCTGETEDEGGNSLSAVPISLCSRCYNVSGELIKLPLGDIPKVFFEKRSNYAETDADSEWWVQCSKCESWQHQICALFNGRRKEANAEYTCVNCFLKEVENGQCESLDPIKVLGASDLPRTVLSDHIEKWLFTQLKIEREERAANLGKKVEEVLGVEGLCVRVVSSVDRIAYVQPNFKEFLKNENYPSEFPYKSKAIVLFQKIEGVDVCLFAMYVQEYGSQCPPPNLRHTYISYIDSVKYFRPEIRSSSGEALRTFVYHGILIGYLDYCKKRGFASCSLWACPPTKHDDYILYCHPTSQKMPKAEKLRSWYQGMITRAIKEKVVVERTNLYDYYLIPTNDCKTNISAAHLPYCDNDFWPGEAEYILSNKEKGGSHKKETEPKGRAIRAAKRGLMDGKPDDIMLLHKLGERMRSMKEDFIVIYLQPTCKHCRRAIVNGTRWACTGCKNFLLCHKCYSEEEELPMKDKHPAGSKFKHEFQKVKEPALPATDDPDPCKECEFFDSRADLLRMCQNRLYQFDTLRRAKHSTMMLLHYLHTPSCSSCHIELDSDEITWQCPTCPGYYRCQSCYTRGVGESAHDHKLVRLCEMVTNTGTGARIGNAMGHTRNTSKQLALETLVHASQCLVPRCERRLCRKMKLLFRHGVQCKVRQRGGCLLCKKVWYLIQLHCSSCQERNCNIRRCKEIRYHICKKIS